MGEAQQDRLAADRIIINEAHLVLISPEAILNYPRYCEMLLTSVYKERLVAVAVGEAHLVKEWLEYFIVQFIHVYIII